MRYPGQVQATIELLKDTIQSDAPADVLATKYFRSRRYIGSGDRRVISGLAFAIIRHRLKLDWWVERIGLKGSNQSRALVITAMVLLEHKSHEEIKDVFSGQEYGPASLSAMETNALARMDVFELDHPDMSAYVVLGLPEWSYVKLNAVFGEKLAQEMGAINGQAPLDLRANTLLTSREEVKQKLLRAGWGIEETALSPLGLRVERGKPLSSHELFQNGFVEVQDEGSQLIALLCDARPGQAVLDYCAGAGGKTLALAASMQNKGRLMATDIAEHRLVKAKQRLRRAGVSNHELKLLDEQGMQWQRRQAGRFDRVLVDAPCSGSGTWRRNPDLKMRFNEADLNELVSKQREILEAAAPLVKKGGYLAYATCSLYRDENEEQVEAFLERHPEFQLKPIQDVWGACVGTECPLSTSWMRLSPHQHHTDGFFMALLEKN